MKARVADFDARKTLPGPFRIEERSIKLDSNERKRPLHAGINEHRISEPVSV
jgi:hypothetical protein